MVTWSSLQWENNINSEKSVMKDNTDKEKVTCYNCILMTRKRWRNDLAPGEPEEILLCKMWSKAYIIESSSCHLVSHLTTEVQVSFKVFEHTSDVLVHKSIKYCFLFFFFSLPICSFGFNTTKKARCNLALIYAFLLLWFMLCCEHCSFLDEIISH